MLTSLLNDTPEHVSQQQLMQAVLVLIYLPILAHCPERAGTTPLQLQLTECKAQTRPHADNVSHTQYQAAALRHAHLP